MNVPSMAAAEARDAARHVVNGDVRIRYLDNDPGRPEGLPLLFVPGITDFADEYLTLLDLCGPRRLLVVEMRGRGGSDAPATGYSVAEQASDIEAVLAAAGVDRFHLMTFSRGTTPGLEVALRQPPRAQTVSIGDYQAAELALPAHFVETLWASRWRGRPMPERVARHVLEQIQRASRPRELWADLAALGVPVLVGRGGDGGILTDEHVERYRAHLPDVEVVTVVGAGHDLFRPDRMVYPRAVLEFIRRRAPGT
jgi:non-heme chloroperoxidase